MEPDELPENESELEAEAAGFADGAAAPWPVPELDVAELEFTNRS